jgi:MFS family permease
MSEILIMGSKYKTLYSGVFRFPKIVWILGLVSLFADIASEMVYPIFPVYLKQLGYSALFIGFLDGAGIAIAGLCKSYFGKLSDYTGKRILFIRLGYFLSAIAKPIPGLSTFSLALFLGKGLDRTGKGLRTGARDALLTEQGDGKSLASIFSFHRGMDTLGAAIGPVLALIYLYFFPGNYGTIFLIAFLPGLISVGLTFLIPERISVQTGTLKKPSFFSFFSYWKNSNSDYKKVTSGLFLFALFNSSDTFLLLKLKEDGLSDTNIILAYILFNLAYAVFTIPAGILSKKTGVPKLIFLSMIIFGLTYLGFAFLSGTVWFISLFLCYAFYNAISEGLSKVWVSGFIPKNEKGSALGFFSGVQSICQFSASIIAGLLWEYAGSEWTFIAGTIGSVAGILFLYKKFK